LSWLLLAPLAGACPLLASCGARSPLDVCEVPGAERACLNQCGPGTQQCNGGVWTACTAPPTTRACSNACGPGTETCADDAWSPCVVPDAMRSCDAPCGPGQQTCTHGAWQACQGPQMHPPTLQATVRDFDDTDPDFASDAGRRGRGPVAEKGIVDTVLGDDDTPTYRAAPGGSTHGPALFYDWYHDVPGDNESVQLPIPLVPETGDPTMVGFDRSSFFPIDGMLLGNQGRPHNYDFTMQLATSFLYTGGETYRFLCDDDCWVFLNRTLALDLGGLHTALPGSIDLDGESAMLGIVKGNRYPMHVFYAERHPVGAVLHMDLTAADIATCDP
jgi:fibro-slime domain-containing protein